MLMVRIKYVMILTFGVAKFATDLSFSITQFTLKKQMLTSTIKHETKGLAILHKFITNLTAHFVQIDSKKDIPKILSHTGVCKITRK